MCTDEAKKMTSVDLLYPAIIVFALLVIGLVLTVMEFDKIENSGDDRDSDHRQKDK